MLQVLNIIEQFAVRGMGFLWGSSAVKLTRAASYTCSGQSGSREIPGESPCYKEYLRESGSLQTASTATPIQNLLGCLHSPSFLPGAYSVRLKSGVAISSVPMPKRKRKRRSNWMATNPPFLSRIALKP